MRRAPSPSRNECARMFHVEEPNAMSMSIKTSSLPVAVLASLLVAGCGDGGDGSVSNVKPDYIGTVSKTTYNGTTDDLATGGLGKPGLAGAAPTFADPANPTSAELRRLTIYNNYRALVDVNNPNGGYGTLYGPNVDVNGNA